MPTKRRGLDHDPAFGQGPQERPGCFRSADRRTDRSAQLEQRRPEAFRRYHRRQHRQAARHFLRRPAHLRADRASKITGGTAIISGNFTLDETKTLARRLNAGALPVPITLITQQTVDATLGATSLQRSLFAGLIGFLAVVAFMLLIYRLPGLMAALASAPMPH